MSINDGFIVFYLISKFDTQCRFDMSINHFLKMDFEVINEQKVFINN